MHVEDVMSILADVACIAMILIVARLTILYAETIERL